MKKFILQTVLPIMLLSVAVFIIGSSCSSDPPLPTPPALTCDDAEPILEPIFTTIGNQGNMDLQQHEYKFISSVDGVICALGYRSLVQNTPFFVFNTQEVYTLEIVEGNGHSVSQSFSSTQIEYANLPSEFTVTAGTEYTIRRTGGDGLNSMKSFENT